MQGERRVEPNEKLKSAEFTRKLMVPSQSIVFWLVRPFFGLYTLCLYL